MAIQFYPEAREYGKELDAGNSAETLQFEEMVTKLLRQLLSYLTPKCRVGLYYEPRVKVKTG